VTGVQTCALPICYEEAVKQYGGFLLKKNAKQIKKHFGVEE